MPTLSKQNIATLKNAAKKLTGAKRRAFEAQVTLDYFDAKAYLAEQAIGWDRKTIALGLKRITHGDRLCR
jgi:hypothetical protein